MAPKTDIDRHLPNLFHPARPRQRLSWAGGDYAFSDHGLYGDFTGMPIAPSWCGAA